jgi:hypothetical protein
VGFTPRSSGFALQGLPDFNGSASAEDRNRTKDPEPILTLERYVISAGALIAIRSFNQSGVRLMAVLVSNTLWDCSCFCNFAFYGGRGTSMKKVVLIAGAHGVSGCPVAAH